MVASAQGDGGVAAGDNRVCSRSSDRGAFYTDMRTARFFKNGNCKKENHVAFKYKVVFKNNLVYMDTVDTPQNDVVPMIDLVWHHKFTS